MLDIPYQRASERQVHDWKLSKQNEKNKNQHTFQTNSESLDTNQTVGRVLLVEDNEDNRALIIAYMRKEKLQVDIAINGQEAVDKYIQVASKQDSQQKRPYNVILMDIQMPVKDGLQAKRLLLESIHKYI